MEALKKFGLFGSPSWIIPYLYCVVKVAWFKRGSNFSIGAPKQTKLFQCSHLLQIEVLKNSCWSRTKAESIRATSWLVNYVDFTFVSGKYIFCKSARGVWLVGKSAWQVGTDRRVDTGVWLLGKSVSHIGSLVNRCVTDWYKWVMYWCRCVARW